VGVRELGGVHGTRKVKPNALCDTSSITFLHWRRRLLEDSPIKQLAVSQFVEKQRVDCTNCNRSISWQQF